jgi:exosortase
MRALLLWLPLLVAYATTIWWCTERWNDANQYFAHCWLVPVVAFVVAFRQRAEWSPRQAAIDGRGWWLLGIGLLLHLAGAALMIDSWSAMSLCAAVPGAAWLCLGRHRLHGMWPVVWLVVFAVPLPIYLETGIASMLKEIAVQGGSWLANGLGAGIVRNGVYLQPRGLPGALYVADACGGLRSLLAMLTMAYCLAFFFGASSWPRRVLLLLLAPVFAICANTIRIVLLCLLARWYGVPFAESTGHTVANVAEWVALVAALLATDQLLARWLPARVPGPPPPPPAQEPPSRWWRTAIALWLLAVPLLLLSCYRPFASQAGRADLLPDAIAGYALVRRSTAEEAEFRTRLPGWIAALGTRDFVWRRYRDAAGGRINLVALYHDANWKSVHPPRICIQYSNMDIEVDDLIGAPGLGDGVQFSRILARSRDDGWRYVTLSVFGTEDWIAGDYWDFTLHHLPRALVRAKMSGFLLRVESPVEPGETPAAAEARCDRFLRGLLPKAQELLR